MQQEKSGTSVAPLLNLWVFTSEGLLISHLSNEDLLDQTIDPDIFVGFLLAITDLAGQYRGSQIQGIILGDRQLYYKRLNDLFAVGETLLDFSKSKELRDSLLFVLNRFSEIRRDTPGLIKLDDFESTRSEIESYLVFNGLLEKKQAFKRFTDAREEIVDNIGVLTSQCLLPEGTLITGSIDHFLKIWDLTSKGEIFFVEGHTETIRSIVYLGERLASLSETGEVLIWDVNTWQILDRFSINCEVQKAIVDPRDSSRLLILEPHRISLLHLESHTLTPAVFEEDPHELVFACFLFEGELVLSVHADGSIYFYDGSTLTVGDRGRMKLQEDDEIQSTIYLPRESAFIAMTKHGMLIKYDPNRNTSDLVPILIKGGDISYSAYDSQLDALFLGFRDGWIRILLPFARLTKSFRIEFKAHDDAVTFVKYLAREDVCVSCSAGRDIRIWSDVQFKEAVRILRAGKNKVENVYNHLKDAQAWLNRYQGVQTQDEAKQTLLKIRLYRSRVKSYKKALQPVQPWWLRQALDRELGEAENLLDDVNMILAEFERNELPRISEIVGDEEEEEEKIDLDSLGIR